MAIKYIATTVLDVGQGQSTFACIYDDSASPGKIIHTLLFDCGSDKKSPETDNNIDYIAGRLASMDTPTLDLLVFSHSDSDHISLMYYVIEAYGKKTKTPLKIKSTWYAGDEDFYTKDGFNILDYLAKYCKAFTTPDFSESQFKKATGEWAELIWQDPATTPTVKVGMLIGNVIDDKPGVLVKDSFGTAGEKKNRVSIVCALMHDDRSFLICGDATNRTMAWVNHAFGGKSLSKTLMVTVPHHGSRGTGLDVSSTQVANQKAIDVVKTFVKTANAKTVTISAFQKHDHPSLEMVNYFTPNLATAQVVDDDRLKKSHFTLFNVDISLKKGTSSASIPQGYHTFTTDANVYATNYYDAKPTFSYQFTGKKTGAADAFIGSGTPAINQHACWSFLTSAGASNSMTGYQRMPRSTANAFTDTGTVPQTLAEGVTGEGPIFDTATRTQESAEVIFGQRQPLLTPGEKPMLSVHLSIGTLLQRIRTFR
jgi:hypothetical protein